MEEDSIRRKIIELLPQLNPQHTARILSNIILLLEAQKQGIQDFPLICSQNYEKSRQRKRGIIEQKDD